MFTCFAWLTVAKILSSTLTLLLLYNLDKKNFLTQHRKWKALLKITFLTENRFELVLNMIQKTEHATRYHCNKACILRSQNWYSLF